MRKSLSSSSLVSGGVPRRALLQGLGAAAGVALFASSGCNSKAGRDGPCPQVAGNQIRWLVPFPAGGGYDIYSRLVEPFLQRKIGAEIIVENLPGAGGAVSANKLKLSKPDGLTLGIVNAPGLLVSALSGETEAPNPARDFTVLGRLVRQRAVWCAGANSPIRSIEDVLMTAGKRKILFAISEAGSTNFVNVIVGSSLLNIDAECISGFEGSRGSALAVLRGEADLLSLTFESALDHIEAGDLRPLLQIAVERISSHSSLDGVALLCGDDGMASHRAAELGLDVTRARDNAQALDDLTGSGIVIAGPLGLEEGLFRCLDQNLHEALSDPGFHAAAAGARRSLDIARADEARAELEKGSGTAQRFIPLVRESIRKLRGGG